MTSRQRQTNERPPQRVWPDGKGRWAHKIQATFQPQQHGRQRRQETRQLKD